MYTLAKSIDKMGALGLYFHLHTAGLCNGSTTDSDSVCLGSNPSPAAMTKSLESTVFASTSRLFLFTLDFRNRSVLGRFGRFEW